MYFYRCWPNSAWDRWAIFLFDDRKWTASHCSPTRAHAHGPACAQQVSFRPISRMDLSNPFGVSLGGLSGSAHGMREQSPPKFACAAPRLRAAN